MSRLGTPHWLGPDGFPLFSLHDINLLEQGEKERIYRSLIPERVFREFSVNRENYCDSRGRRRVDFICPAGLNFMRIAVKANPDDRDNAFFIELVDTPFQQIELAFCIINDPEAPRFDVDRDQEGRDNCFGTVRRNIPEEIRAMEAGLSPCQVRKGLQLFTPFLQCLERFADALGMDTIVAEPLSYSNAILYEQTGFDYISGKQQMLWIDHEFAEGGELWKRLDGESPFRRRGMEQTVKGRSWAIHDGILDMAWDNVQIFKTIGDFAGVDTFPNRKPFVTPALDCLEMP